MAAKRRFDIGGQHLARTVGESTEGPARLMAVVANARLQQMAGLASLGGFYMSWSMFDMMLETSPRTN